VAKRRVVQKPPRERGGASVPCPVCSAVPTKVLQTRRDEQLTVWRQRICPHCKTRFNTNEGPNPHVAAPWTTANERAKLTRAA